MRRTASTDPSRLPSSTQTTFGNTVSADSTTDCSTWASLKTGITTQTSPFTRPFAL